MNSTIPKNPNRNARDIAKASFNRILCRRIINIPVIIKTVLVKHTLNGLYAESKKPNSKFMTNRMAVTIRVVFFIAIIIAEGLEALEVCRLTIRREHS